MESYRYVIVGGGMTGHAAARGIRELDGAGTVALLSAEPDRPYARPPLSKKLWTGPDPEESIWLEPVPGVELRLGRRVAAIDRAAREVVDDTGARVRYEKLLLAVGGTARRLRFDDERVLAFRTVRDYRRLRGAVEAGARRVAVVGGGFIGSEIAAALAGRGVAVTMIFPEAGLCARAFPGDLSAFVTRYYGEKGVTVLAGDGVADVRPAGSGVVVRTTGGREVPADLVLAGIGLDPNVDLAARAGLAVENGIDVDERLRTSDPAIWAAGDVAHFPSRALGKKVRVEHEDAALSQGRFAGRAMAGDTATYDHLPSFYSDLFDLGYEAVGELDPRHQIVADWREPFRQGVVYYLDGGRVRGVLLWNTWGQVDAARALVAEPGPHRPEALAGRITG
jgi:3-phenylpropionate/trans-cinnamate dioxygenase ferredoxin reductase component